MFSTTEPQSRRYEVTVGLLLRYEYEVPGTVLYLACTRNWLKFKQNYEGVPYIDVDYRFMNRPKSEIDPINQTQKYCRETLKF